MQYLDNYNKVSLRAKRGNLFRTFQTDKLKEIASSFLLAMTKGINKFEIEHPKPEITL